MNLINFLVRDAKAAAAKRGHDMGKFFHGERLAQGKCRRCGDEAVVAHEGRERMIGGYAIARKCRNEVKKSSAK